MHTTRVTALSCIVRGVALAYTVWSVQFVGRPGPTRTCGSFKRLCQEVNVEEIWTAGLPDELVSGDEEMDVLPNPLLASLPGKEVRKEEVQSSDSEVDLFAPPPTPPVPQKRMKGKKALPSAPPQVKGKKALPSAPPI